MADLEDKLTAALSAEDEAFLKELRTERGLFEQIAETFRGPMRMLNIMAYVFTLIATGVGVWAVVKMFGAETDRALILWAGAAWAAWTLQIGLKQWLWQRMNTLSILRELKRIELRVAQLER